MNKKTIIIISLSLILVILSVTLISTEKFQNKLSKQIFDKCKYDSHCAITFLQDASKSHDKEIIMNAVNELIFTYSESLPFCHKNAHHVGNFVYGYLGNVTDAIELTDPTACGGATIHGIVENYLDSQVLLYNVDPAQVDLSICPDSLKSPTINRWECIHGLGHGLANIYGYDISNATRVCQSFEDWEQITCAKGLFMENVNRFIQFEDTDFDKNNLTYPCNKINDTMAGPCYHYQTRFINYVLKDPEKTIDFCKSVEDKFSKYCFRGIGNLYASLVVSDINKIDLLCNTKNIPYEKLTYCYQGVAMTFADNRSIPEALIVCQSIPEEFQNDCVNEVGKWIKLVNSDSEEQCSMLNSELAKTCMNSKIDEISIL